MGSIISAIHDDMEEYEDLCRKYGEKVQFSRGGSDCYSEHARSLKERQRRDWEIERKVREEQRIAAMPKQDDVLFVKQ